MSNYSNRHKYQLQTFRDEKSSKILFADKINSIPILKSVTFHLLKISKREITLRIVLNIFDLFNLLKVYLSVLL